MKRIKLVVAYDGTNYHGWQVQPREITIEGVLNEALTALTGEEIQVIGASRTDAEVLRAETLRYLIRNPAFREKNFPML